MQEYTRIEPPTKITTAGNNVLRGTARGIFVFLGFEAIAAFRSVALSLL